MDIFEAIGRKMAWLGQRQSVLAQNIANADTPDYRPHDLKEGAFARELRRSLPAVNPTSTNPLHLSGTRPKAGADEAEQRRTYEIAPSGNSVVLEEQMIKVGKTQMDYQMLSNIYRKHVDMLRTALGRGGG